MLQYSSEVRAVFVTTHVGYAEVPGLLTKVAILDAIELGAQAMRRIRGGEPGSLSLALTRTPGRTGCSVRRNRRPSSRRSRRRKLGLNVEGRFRLTPRFCRPSGDTDLFVCMYHDQGHIPLKALFDEAVNTTLGRRSSALRRPRHRARHRRPWPSEPRQPVRGCQTGANFL